MKPCFSNCVALKKLFQEQRQRDGVPSPDCRLFFRLVLQALHMAHTLLNFAHRFLSWESVLLRRKWGEGTDSDPEIVFTDSGNCFLGTEKRQYVGDDLDMTSRRAMNLQKEMLKSASSSLKAASRVQQYPKPIQAITRDCLQKVMCSKGDVANPMKILSEGTEGYRPPAPKVFKGKRKSSALDFTALRCTMAHGKAHDIYSVGAMLAEVSRDKNEARWASSKSPAAAWEETLHNLDSKEDIMEFLNPSATCVLAPDSIKAQNLKLQVRLLSGMLRVDFQSRYSAAKAGKHDFFVQVFLSDKYEALAAGPGICCPGGVPPWAAVLSNRVCRTPLQELKIKRHSGKRGLGVFCQQPAKEHDLMTYYTGRTCHDGKHLFSKHVYPTETYHRYVDGFYGSGAWKIERLTEERSVGSVINSSRIEGRIHSPGNCYVEWDKFIIDSSGNIRIPVRARLPLEEGAELDYDYAFNTGHCGAFREDYSDESE